MWVSSILGALKALPILAEGIAQLASTIHDMRDEILSKHIEELKEENAKIIKQIEKASTDEELKKLIRDLNINLNR